MEITNKKQITLDHITSHYIIHFHLSLFSFLNLVSLVTPRHTQHYTALHLDHTTLHHTTPRHKRHHTTLHYKRLHTTYITAMHYITHRTGKFSLFINQTCFALVSVGKLPLMTSSLNKIQPKVSQNNL